MTRMLPNRAHALRVFFSVVHRNIVVLHVCSAVTLYFTIRSLVTLALQLFLAGREEGWDFGRSRTALLDVTCWVGSCSQRSV